MFFFFFQCHPGNKTQDANLSKVFVANPHKSIAVQRILLNNKDKLLKFLATFLHDRTDDEQFIDERSFLIKQINALPPVPVEPIVKPAVMGPAGGAGGGASTAALAR
jgi:hypothetical protein